jgi:hypothetical protein
LKDARLERRALKSRWPIREDVRHGVIIRQSLIATSPDSSPRESSVAARVLLSADGLNLDDEKVQREDLLERLLTRLEAIYGIVEGSTANGMASNRNGHARNGAVP